MWDMGGGEKRNDNFVQEKHIFLKCTSFTENYRFLQ